MGETINFRGNRVGKINQTVLYHSRMRKSREIKKSVLAHLNKNRKQANENSGLLDFVCLFSFKGENFSLAVPKVT